MDNVFLSELQHNSVFVAYFVRPDFGFAETSYMLETLGKTIDLVIRWRTMTNQKTSFKTENELQEVILQEKKKGMPDLEIGQKYGVTFRYIEKLITQSHGINVSAFNISKKTKTLYPKDFKEEQTTVWSFKQRSKWATHSE